MKKAIAFLACTCFILMLSHQAFCDACGSQSLAQLVGASCTIGDFQFIFGHGDSDIAGSPANDIPVSFSELAPFYEYAPIGVSLIFTGPFSLQGNPAENDETGFGIYYTVQSTDPWFAVYLLDVEIGEVALNAGGNGFAEAVFDNTGLQAYQIDDAGTVYGTTNPGPGGCPGIRRALVAALDLIGLAHQSAPPLSLLNFGIATSFLLIALTLPGCGD